MSKDTRIQNYLLRGPTAEQAKASREIREKTQGLCNFLEEGDGADNTTIPSDCVAVVLICNKETHAIARVLLDGESKRRVHAVLISPGYELMARPAKYQGRVHYNVDDLLHVLTREKAA